MSRKKVVLAFSGGLDTTYCAIYLSKELDYELHTVSVNTGGFDIEEKHDLEQKALQLGASEHTHIEATEEFYDKAVKYLLFGNVLKNHTYPLSVSSERVFQAMAVAEHAKKIGADAVAHGSTGAGNDQVRFDLVFRIMLPDAEIITPVRDQRLSRQQEVAYLSDHGIKKNWEKAKYSINKGLWGTSVGGDETLTSDKGLPEEAWPTPLTASREATIELTFQNGEMTAVNGEKWDPVTAIEKLQAIAGPYGVGRGMHVGDTIIGIKGRVGFEAAAPMIMIKAHQTLEKHILSKWQMYWKDQLSEWYGMLLHEGQYLDPVMRNIESFLEDTQQNVSGTVTVKLEPKHFEIVGITSDADLMQSRFGQYGEINKAWSGEDVKGFTKILANSSLIHKMTNDD